MRVARVDVPRNDGRQIHLLVRDGRAGGAGKMDDFEALEADCAAPFFEIGGRIIERDRSQQDLGIPEAERSLQNCVRCWRRCLHTVVDVANLPGVTSDE